MPHNFTSKLFNGHLNLSVNCLFAFLTGTFFRHLEKGSKNETTESASLQEPTLASNSATSDLSISEDDDERSEPDESKVDELGS